MFELKLQQYSDWEKMMEPLKTVMRVNHIVAWAIAVLLAAAVVGLLHAVLGAMNPLLGTSYFDYLFFFGFGVALAIAVLIGVPVALLYRWQGWTDPIGVLIGGFLIGSLPFCLFVDWKLIAIFGGYGALAALVFWMTLRMFGAVGSRILRR